MMVITYSFTQRGGNTNDLTPQDELSNQEHQVCQDNQLNQHRQIGDQDLVSLIDVVAEARLSRRQLVTLILQNNLDVYWRVPTNWCVDVVPWRLVEDEYVASLLKKDHPLLRDVSLKSYSDEDYPWPLSERSRNILQKTMEQSLRVTSAIVKLHRNKGVSERQYFQYVRDESLRFSQETAYDWFRFHHEHQHAIFDRKTFPLLPREEQHSLTLDMSFDHLQQLGDHHIGFNFPLFKQVYCLKSKQWLALTDQQITVVRKVELTSPLVPTGAFEPISIQWEDLCLSEDQVNEYCLEKSPVNPNSVPDSIDASRQEMPISLKKESLRAYLDGPDLNGDEEYLSPTLKVLVKFALKDHQYLFDCDSRVSVEKVKNHLRTQLIPYSGEAQWGEEVLKYISKLLRLPVHEHIPRSSERIVWVGMNHKLKTICWLAHIFWADWVKNKGIATQLECENDVKKVIKSWSKPSIVLSDIEKNRHQNTKAYDELIKELQGNELLKFLPSEQDFKYFVTISRVIPSDRKIEVTKNMLNNYFKKR